MKALVLSALYFLALLVMVFLTDFALSWVLDHVLFKIINWYNHISIFWEVVIFLAGASLFIGFVQLIGGLLSAINALALLWFPLNLFTITISILVFLCNAGLSIKVLWDSFPSFTFLTILEFIVLCILVLSVNSIFLRTDKSTD